MSETAQVPADTPQVLLEHHLKARVCPPSCANTTTWRGSAQPRM
jgi:hypothetical protein